MNETWVTIVGNVADDPRHFQTNGGVATAFRLAQTSRNERNGEWTNAPTSFYDITCFRRLADHVAGSVVKGQPVIVHGRLEMREWQRDDKRGRSAHVTVSHMGHDLAYGVSSFLRPRRESDSPAVAAEAPAFVEPAREDLATADLAATGRSDSAA